MPTFRQRVFSLAPWAVKEWLVAAEARRLNCYRRYGDPGPIREAYAFSRYEALSPEELRAWQLQRLQEVVDAARRRSPFYAGRVPEAVRSLDDLAGIPLLTKAEVREHTDDILARGLPRGAVLRDATSGSTGSPLHFYVPKEGVRVRFAIIDSYLAHLGCPYGQRRMRFGGQWLIPQSRTRPSFWVYNRVDNQLHMSPYHLDVRTIPYYLQKINAFHPLYITGVAHAPYLIAQYVLEHGGLEFTPRAVLTDSEQLPPAHREIIERGFGAPCYDIYGLREMNWVAVHSALSIATTSCSSRASWRWSMRGAGRSRGGRRGAWCSPI